jgi:phospholipase/carboxylesterase
MAAAAALTHRVRRETGRPEGALVLFHGRGTSENDLFPLLEALDPEGRLAGVTPRAPLSLPPGGAHWYVVRHVGFPDRGTFDASFEQAAAFVDSLPDLVDVPLERTVLGGFSQGAVMSYALAFGPGRPRPAAVLAMSGFMPTVEGFELDLTRLDGYPVAITHGELDPIIEVGFGRDARERLEGAGAEVRYREAPIGHQIEPAWLPDLTEWLRGTLTPAGRPG